MELPHRHRTPRGNVVAPRPSNDERERPRRRRVPRLGRRLLSIRSQRRRSGGRPCPQAAVHKALLEKFASEIAMEVAVEKAALEDAFAKDKAALEKRFAAQKAALKEKLAKHKAALAKQFATELATEVAAQKAALEDAFAKRKAALERDVAERKAAIEKELALRKKNMALLAIGAVALCVSLGAVGLPGTIGLAIVLCVAFEYEFVAGCVQSLADAVAPIAKDEAMAVVVIAAIAICVSLGVVGLPVTIVLALLLAVAFSKKGPSTGLWPAMRKRWSTR